MTLVFSRGDQVKRFDVKFPVPIYRGVYVSGQSYEKGDCVTFGGSQWIAKLDTSEKPGGDAGARAWQLSVKVGRDGKDGRQGPQGPAGLNGKDGRDLTQIGSDGRKW